MRGVTIIVTLLYLVMQVIRTDTDERHKSGDHGTSIKGLLPKPDPRKG